MHPPNLVATIAARFLEPGSKDTEEERFAEAARRACHFLDICEKVALWHMPAATDLAPSRAAIPYKKALFAITHTRPRTKAERLYEEFRTELELDPTGLENISVREARKRAVTIITDERKAGIAEGRVAALEKFFSEWKARRLSEARRAAGKKGGRATAEAPGRGRIT